MRQSLVLILICLLVTPVLSTTSGNDAATVTETPSIFPTDLLTPTQEISQIIPSVAFGNPIKNSLKDTAPKLKGNRIILETPVTIQVENANDKNQTVRFVQSNNEITLPDVPVTGTVAIRFDVGTITYVIRRNE